MSIAIPQTLLTSLVASLEAESRRIARDAAKILRVPEKEVLAVVKGLPKLKLQVCQDADVPTSCPIFTPIPNGPLVARCRKACLLGTGRCLAHQNTEESFLPPNHSLIQVTRLERTETSPEALWCHEETRTVQNRSGVVVGTLTEEGVLELEEYLEAEKEGDEK